MKQTTSKFQAELHRPAISEADGSWTFCLVPKEVSDTLPRRGRTTVEGSINGHRFQATLEPDGQLSHWLKVDTKLQEAVGAVVGDTLAIEIVPVEHEPDPEVPTDLAVALAAAPEARRIWDAITTIARLDWIHWIVTAKQTKTREKRIRDACDMLANGKTRVCCFDPSGFYSKAFKAPKTAPKNGG